jgi:hypothetical protein
MDNYFILSSKDGDKWAQGSSQHDKCQVGNMHTYSLDLVHFPIILSSFLHSLNCHLYPVVTILYLYCTLVSFGAGLKKWVVRPVGY